MARLFVDKVPFTKSTEVVVGFKRIAERVHFLVTAPALLLLNDLETLPQVAMGFFGELGVDPYRQIGNDARQQMFLNPFATSYRIIFEIAAVGREPSRVS